MAFASYRRRHRRSGARTATALAVLGKHLPDAIPAFDPRTLSGLAFWYHPAAADVVKDDTTGKVSRLIDLSGNGNDATQFTSANQVTWESAVLSTGDSIRGASGDKMAGPIVDMHAGFWLCTVIKPSNVTAEHGFASIADGTANDRLAVFITSTGQIAAHVFQNHTTWIGRRTAASTLAADAEHVVSVTWDGTFANGGIKIYVDGTQADTAGDGNGTVTGVTAPTIAYTVASSAATTNGNLIGDMGDHLLFTAVPNATDRKALEDALAGTTRLYVPPAPPPAFSGTVYVATTGTATGAGTQADPIDEATFLSKGVGPGATVNVRGGTYTENWVINCSGTEADPITIQATAGEHVKLSNGYLCNGSDVTLSGTQLNAWLEIYQTDTTRTTTQAGSNPTDVSLASIECKIVGARSQVIGAIVHDLGNGLVSETGGSGAGFIDCVSYNHGWEGSDRAHGHSAYLHNDTGNATKSLTRCVLFNSFDIGTQLFSRAGGLEHISVTDGAIFGSGLASATFGEQRNLDVSTASPISNLTFDGLRIYRQGNGTAQTVKINDVNGTPASLVTFTNNHVRGAVGLNECDSYTATGNTLTTGGDATNDGASLLAFRLRPSGTYGENSINSNTYVAVTGNNDPFYTFEDDNAAAGFVNHAFAGWQSATGFDANSTYTEGSPTGSTVTVRASTKETGRAVIIVENPAGNTNVSADLSAVLAVNDVYSIWHVYGLFGTPVVNAATYAGGTVALTQTGYVAPTPTGYGTTPDSTSPYFNVFLVRKVA